MMGNAVVDFGNGFVADFTDLLGTEGDTETLTDDVSGNADNAAIEGEVKTDAPEKPALVVEPEKPAETEKDAEPEKPKEPEGAKTYEFKIKYRGEELTEKLTEEQIVARLQMAKDYSVKTEELSRRKQEIKAVEEVAKTPWFKEAYEEAIRTGALQAPEQVTTSVDPLDEYEFEKRKTEPDFEEIRGRMREYALGLSEEAQLILQRNHKVFLREYDRFAESYRKAKAQPSEPAKATVTPEVAKKILQSKEVAKQQAVVEKPGVGSPDADPGIENKKRLAAVRKEAKAGEPGAVQKLAYYYMYGELPNF